MDEGRILDKLDAIEGRTVETLVEITKIQEQVKDVPEIRARIGALEKWRWTAMGAIAAAGTSLATQVFTAMKGAGA